MNHSDRDRIVKDFQIKLGRIAERLKSANLLLASGMDEDAREVLAAACAQLKRTGQDLLGLADNTTGSTAGLALSRLKDLGNLSGPGNPDVQLQLDAASLALDACWSLLSRLRKGPLRTTSHDRTKVLAASLAGLLVCVLTVGAVWGPSIYGRLREEADKRRLREVQGVLIEMASLAQNAKKASEQNLVKLTGETCSDCECGKSKNLQQLFETDGCLKRWRKAIGIIFKAATGKEKIPSRFLADPWGAPFALNENEGEVPGECSPDTIRSAGPDGILNTADDVGIQIPTAFCQQSN